MAKRAKSTKTRKSGSSRKATKARPRTAAKGRASKAGKAKTSAKAKATKATAAKARAGKKATRPAAAAKRTGTGSKKVMSKGTTRAATAVVKSKVTQKLVAAVGNVAKSRQARNVAPAAPGSSPGETAAKDKPPRRAAAAPATATDTGSGARTERRLPDWMADHIERYLRTNGADGHIWRGMPTLLLTTTGRSSGEPRLLPLIYGRDGDHFLVVGSRGGAPDHPSWYKNIVANPQVEVQVGADRFRGRARPANRDERPRLWRMMTKIFPEYDKYQAKTQREIPVVVIERTS